jgi:hypothetical protein
MRWGDWRARSRLPMADDQDIVTALFIPLK